MAKKQELVCREPTSLDRLLAVLPIPVLGEYKAYHVSLYDWAHGVKKNEKDIFCSNGSANDALVFNVSNRRFLAYSAGLAAAALGYVLLR